MILGNNIPKSLKRYFVGFICFFAVLLHFNILSRANVGAMSASEALKSTLHEVMSILQDEEFQLPGYKMQRRNAILCVLEYRFDFEEMSKRSLSREWKKRSTQEKEHFITIFGQLIQNTYIRKIESYSDEEILFFGEKQKGNKTLVPTAIKKNNVEIKIAYKLIKKEGRWRVYDVIVEGVSLVSNFRSQFKDFLAKDSYTSLINRLEGRLENLLSEDT